MQHCQLSLKWMCSEAEESLLTSVLYRSVVKLIHWTPTIAFLTSAVTPSTIRGSTVSVMYLLFGREYLDSSIFNSLVNPLSYTIKKGLQSITIISPIRWWIRSHTCIRSLLSVSVICLTLAKVVGWSSSASPILILGFHAHPASQDLLTTRTTKSKLWIFRDRIEFQMVTSSSLILPRKCITGLIQITNYRCIGESLALRLT